MYIRTLIHASTYVQAHGMSSWLESVLVLVRAVEAGEHKEAEEGLQTMQVLLQAHQSEYLSANAEDTTGQVQVHKHMQSVGQACKSMLNTEGDRARDLDKFKETAKETAKEMNSLQQQMATLQQQATAQTKVTANTKARLNRTKAELGR
jgi:NH3-dependent NAD+ synthetase